MTWPDAARGVFFVLLAVLASQALAASDSSPIRLKKLPPVMRDVAAFPRLASGAEPPSIARINKALTQADRRVRKAARDCLQAGRKHAHWTRKISVPMQGPRYVSLIATDDYFCGGAHPDSSTVALVFDLDTGTLADWAELLPNLAQHTGTDTAGDGSTLGTIASQKLADLYKDMAKHSGSDPACADALKDTELNFILWPDAKQDGLTVQPAGLPHVIASCGPAMTLPVKTLKTLDVNAGLLDAIEAAHQGH
ncbi:MAG TPA: hypothetical protein VIE66_15385 [Methylocella sp.]|jgi:hypothetical protein